MMRHVFFARNDPSAGVVAGGFAAAGLNQPSVRRARDHWHAACVAVEPTGRLDVSTVAALAFHAADHYGVGELVEQGLGETLGESNAAAAAQAAQEGWGDWAWRKAGETASEAKSGVQTVYTDLRTGVQTAYTDAREGASRTLAIPEKIAAAPEAPERWAESWRKTFAELKGPLTAGAVGLTVLGGLYLLTRKA